MSHVLPRRLIAAVLAAIVMSLPSWVVADDNFKSTVRASEIMNGTVTDGLSPVGNVRDLVLNENKTEIEYILYDVWEPFDIIEDESGFVTVDTVRFERGFGPRDLEVRFDQPESMKAPEELRITADEANDRLVSNILGEALQFADDKTRKVTDILIDAETGEVRHFVVETAENTLFTDEPRLLPADEVQIGDRGQLKATVELTDVMNEQKYRVRSPS